MKFEELYPSLGHADEQIVIGVLFTEDGMSHKITDEFIPNNRSRERVYTLDNGWYQTKGDDKIFYHVEYQPEMSSLFPSIDTLSALKAQADRIFEAQKSLIGRIEKQENRKK